MRDVTGVAPSVPSPGIACRALVLGGGFLGTAVAREMGSRDWQVDVLGRARLDLVDPAQTPCLAALLDRRTALVFTSAVTPDRERSEAADRANAAMVEIVARALVLAPPAACVFFSSTAVYGDREGEWAISDETVLAPSGGYGRGKAEAESRLALAAASAGVPLLVLRPSVVYGPHDTHVNYGPSLLVREWRAGEVSLYGEGDDMRDFVYVDDVARAAATLLERGAAGVFNVGGEAASFRHILEILDELQPREVQVLRRPRKLARSRVTVDSARLRAILPDHPLVSLREGLRLTLAGCGGDPAASG